MNEQILAEARRLADEVFRPNAERADQGDINGQVAENVRLLAKAGYFGLGISPEFGGKGADDVTRREYTELMASACGVTAFTQQQLHAGGGFVGGGRSEALRREKLPLFASGQELCGVAFSHLRRPGPRIPLVVMNASDTVEVTLNDLFLPDEYVLSERPPEALKRGDYCGISGHVFLPLGGARGSVHYLRALAEKRGNETFAHAAEELMREIDACRHEALTWSGACADQADYKEHALHARTAAIVLAVRAAHATVTATGGGAHLLTMPPQRLLREAIFYTTTAQTPDVQNGTLDMLLSPECWNQA